MIKIRVNTWLRRRHLWTARLSRESMKRRILRLCVLFLALIVVHSAAMVYLEGLSVREAVWLTIISVTTIGYGDVSASSPLGQLATIVLICFFGIWLLAQLVGEWIDYRIHRRQRMVRGEWSWDMLKKHIVIINAPQNDSTVYLNRLIKQVRQTPMFKNTQVVLVSDLYQEGLPVSLQELNTVHISAQPESRGVLERVGIEKAANVLIIAGDCHSPVSDSVTVDLLDRIKRTGTSARIVVEAVQDENKERFKSMGADAVVRPIRAYPELIVRSLAAPGAEQILENLFTFSGDSTYRYDIALKAKQWKEIVNSILERDLGTPLGYMDGDGVVHTNPAGNTTVDSQAIFVLVREESVPSLELVRQCLV